MDNQALSFGLPLYFISDNGKQFADNPFKKLCEDLRVKKVLSSVAYPQTNGQVERANGSIVEGIKAYRTTQKELPFRLTYSTEAVIPAEVRMPTVRVQEQPNNDRELLLNLDLIEERREMVAIRELKYKRQMENCYNKRVKEVTFKEGEYVMRNNIASRVETYGKLGSRWEGPYIVVEATDKGAYKLWNGIHFKKCYM
ncbi:uncharacterized protein LOC143571561 [Bidens hawaiensis]|uniref:uncharacterized protein LOC143571561 n=1 Tax=Bidens hawaiensis TaxID=980011 RepID=UPI00404B91F4